MLYQFVYAYFRIQIYIKMQYKLLLTFNKLKHIQIYAYIENN